MEYKDFVFEVPSDLPYKREERDKILLPILKMNCPWDWTPSTHFGSKNSFFKKEEKHYARTVIRRWVDMVEN